MHVEVHPAAGEMLLRFVGDRLVVRIHSDVPAPEAYLRTNIGRGAILHAEIVREYRRDLSRWHICTQTDSVAQPPSGTGWRDVPMRRSGAGWEIDLALTEVGFFDAKPYLLNEHRRQVWPPGPNIAITVHPSEYRTANTIYCAFTRMFGATKTSHSTAQTDQRLEGLDKQHYTVIPPSGKFRDLIKEFPHIFSTLGCRILHLLPVNPTPTTYARFGRFGSPYAAEDLTGIDPALVEFDRRTTGVEQFEELTYAAHCHGGRVLLDMVVNHTGWGSTLQEDHPEWFLRKENGMFVSPGAWGTTWEDLVELDHRIPLSWDHIAEAFITWSRRGVDGFRCDAGYKVPTKAWRYIIAKVRHEFPDALFLLEGLGGSWEATEELLTQGGMQWAYSELFQNHSPLQVSGYIDHSVAKSAQAGTLVHYSETHDNERLAARGRVWSLLRNQLCALASHCGAFGYTCGVEWLATERVNVHSSRGLAWGNSENIVPELGRLAKLLLEHPAFFDGTTLERLSGPESQIIVFERVSADKEDRILILVNLDSENRNSFFLPRAAWQELGEPKFDLLKDEHFRPHLRGVNVEFRLEPGEAMCLSAFKEPRGLAGHRYRALRSQYTFAVRALSGTLEPEQIGPHNWTELAALVEADPRKFLASLTAIEPAAAASDLLAAINSKAGHDFYPAVVEWTVDQRRRITMVPPQHWLLITDPHPFRCRLAWDEFQQHNESIEIAGRHFAAFAPVGAFRQRRYGKATVAMTRFNTAEPHITGSILFLRETPEYSGNLSALPFPHGSVLEAPTVLLTNGRGGMARSCVDLGSVQSKYDCVLAANLHPLVPVDRHVFVKRVRIWANADRFISPLNAANLQSFSPGPPARWEFAAIAGDGQVARIEVIADMVENENTTVFSLRLLDTSKPETFVTLTVRFDLEDRNFHSQTHHNGGADHHFSANTHLLNDRSGFEFRPAGDRRVRVSAGRGLYHPSPEWSHNLPHPLEQTRGHIGSGDAFSPGWFEIPLEREVPIQITVTAEAEEKTSATGDFIAAREAAQAKAYKKAGLADSFGRQLALATQAYVVQRDEFKTIIAGYPWFLDWGRDSLICARGLIAAGLFAEVEQLLIAFGRFERDGTLPNTIHGDDASNRDTSDAPLWYGIVCEELAAIRGAGIYDIVVEPKSKRTIRDVLASIGAGYVAGTPNGIKMDRGSGLIWSPSHFTWMDTNYPAGTPREGYPIEIQALWIRLLEQLANLGAPSQGVSWRDLAAKARSSLDQLFWLEEKGWYSDVLIAGRGTAATEADADDALRSNCVIPMMLGLLEGPRARRCLENVLRHLPVPGALRSLAPLPLQRPLPIYGPDWRLLNNPHQPYCGRYEGDEDSQRKPAYHNGTAWTWTFPGVCEAIVRAWNFSSIAREAAKAYLGSMDHLLSTGCVGHLPEILDGDAPHTPRGCDAQAWGVTEALRVWKLLNQE